MNTYLTTREHGRNGECNTWLLRYLQNDTIKYERNHRQYMYRWTLTALLTIRILGRDIFNLSIQGYSRKKSVSYSAEKAILPHQILLTYLPLIDAEIEIGVVDLDQK